MDADEIADDLKRKSIAKILASATFKRSEQLRHLFHWLGQSSLGGNGSLSEYEIGIGVLKRGKDFDPQTDSIVRREMCRLRDKLKRYYADEGSAEPLRLDCSNGYRIQFRWANGRALGVAGGAPCLLILPIRAVGDLNEWAANLFDKLFVSLGSSEFIQLVSQTTSLRYAGRTGDVRDFAAEAGADIIIEGRVQREETTKMISVLWLVDGKSGRIRGQCLISDNDANSAGQYAVEWLRERPEVKREGPLRDLSADVGSVTL